MLKKLAAGALAFLLLATGCNGRLSYGSAASDNAVAQEEGNGEMDFLLSEIDTLKVAYNNTDLLEPYQLKSAMNQNLMSLLYDSLVKLSQSYAAEPVIAREVVVTPEQCVVSLRSDVRFSNGTPLTAEDVVYSAWQVQVPGNNYYGLLSNVTAIKATDDYTVTFTLAEPDIWFEKMLTFPIVSAKNPQIGSGRYKLQANGEQKQLIINESWYETNKSQIKTIDLINQLDKETLIYSLKLGTINYVYSDLAENESSSLGNSTQTVPLNNMVYLGVNSTKRILASEKMRQALSLAINRNALVNQTYASRAEPARAPFHPRLQEVRALELSLEQDTVAAAALLDELGYQTANKDSEGYYVTGQGRLRLRLLVNSANNAKKQVAHELQQSFKKLGIEIVLDERSFTDYQAALTAWDFDLYLGEVKLYNNMNLSAMLTPASGLGFGITEDEALVAANKALRAGTMSMKDFVALFEAELPFIPLMYRNGVVSFSREVFFDAPATEQDNFYNIENW